MEEDTIRADDLRQDQQIAILQDVGYLLFRYDEFIEVACPACGKLNYRYKFQKNGFTYVDCLSCQTFYINPRPTPKLLADFYHQSRNYAFWDAYVFPRSEFGREQYIIRPRLDSVLAVCDAINLKSGRLLEIGAGYGTFCRMAKDSGFFSKVLGFEPTPSLANTCRQKGINVIESMLEDAADKYKQQFDIIVAFEVIEHVFSPQQFISCIWQMLTLGGVMILSCPNGMGFDITTLGVLSDSVDHEHLNYFNPSSLSNLCTMNGFDIIILETPGMLDAELVRKKVLCGSIILSDQPFLQRILIDQWENFGEKFQIFLAENLLSSHLRLVATKPLA